MNRRNTLAASLAAIALAIAFAPPALSASRRIRLTVDVSMEGRESVTNRGDHTSGRFREAYRLVTYLESDGELMQFNPRDPQYSQKMMAMQQAASQRAGSSPSAARKMNADELKAHLQKKQAACGADTDCLMKLAVEAQELVAQMDSGGGGAPVVAYTGDEPPRYLMFSGRGDCKPTAHAFVERTLEGTLADTGASVPYRMVEKVDYENDADEKRLICIAHQGVLDTRDDTFYLSGVMLPRVRGTLAITLRGATKTSVTTAAGHTEPLEWLAGLFSHVPRSGERSRTLALTRPEGVALHAGRFAGEASMRMSWKIEDVK